MIFKKSYAKEINFCTTTAQNMFMWRQQICSVFRHITGATDDGTCAIDDGTCAIDDGTCATDNGICHEPKHVADLLKSNEHILRM